jgi:hypothetical protein
MKRSIFLIKIPLTDRPITHHPIPRSTPATTCEGVSQHIWWAQFTVIHTQATVNGMKPTLYYKTPEFLCPILDVIMHEVSFKSRIQIDQWLCENTSVSCCVMANPYLLTMSFTSSMSLLVQSTYYAFVVEHLWWSQHLHFQYGCYFLDSFPAHTCILQLMVWVAGTPNFMFPGGHPWYFGSSHFAQL